MGADIHGYLEVLRPEGDWIAINHVNPARSYTWFSIIAGVRGRVDWCGPNPWNRGIPSDPSDAWKEYVGPDHSASGLHSLTWLSLSEIIRANQIWSEEVADRFIDPACPPDVYQEVPTPDTPVDTLYMGHNDDGFSGSDVTIPWVGTVEDMRDKSKPFDQTVRMVVGFDS